MAQGHCAPRLIPSLIDQYAQTQPGYVFAQIPITADFADGVKDVTIATFARAVNAVAYRIKSRIGRSAKFDTIAYIGPMDLGYYVVALAASKVGYKTLLPSPRNSIEGLLSLLESTHCRYLLSAPGAKVDHILAKHPMQHSLIETFDEWAFHDSVIVDASHDVECASNDPFIVIHTSGSTGLPKPVILYHGSLATVDEQRRMPPLHGYEAQVKVYEGSNTDRMFVTLPPFHVAGILGALVIALYYQKTIVWPPSGRPINAEMVDSLLDNVEVDSCFLAPSVLDEMSRSQASLEKLGKLEYVQYAGGPLSQEAGDTVSKYTKIRNALGSSEAAYYPIYDQEPEDWIYFHFNPAMEGIQFREVSDGLYEQVFVRHPSTDPYHSLWYTFPDQQEYAPKDLFSKHPSKPDLWLYEGRSDDVIVFSNGEKFNPNTMEATLRAHPEIGRVVVVGQARFQPAALIELKDKTLSSDRTKESVLESLGVYVVEANKAAPGYAKLQLEYIAFTKPEKPMLVTDKGTVKRSATLKAYQEEIDQLYSDAEALGTSLPVVHLDVKDADALIKSLQRMLAAAITLEEVEPDQDIFSSGADSLQVMNIVRQLRSSLGNYSDEFPKHLISAKIVYAHPTAAQLAGAIQQLTVKGEDIYQNLDDLRVKKMEDMLARYTEGLPKDIGKGVESDDEFTIALTGSTGSLGSYLIDTLLASGRISKIICLNRGEHSEEKQISANSSRGLNTQWDGLVSFLKTDLSKHRFGLSPSDYDILLAKTSYIIHNQWQVDFNLSLDSFEPHLAGVRSLIDLSNQALKRPPILFTSTISTLGGWSSRHPDTKVPEDGFRDFTIPAAMGYGESKYVAELMLEAANKICGLSASVCRIGQVAGPVIKGGMWNKQEWLPSLIASSKYLGKVPINIPGQDNVPWIPVDLTARIIVDLVSSDMQGNVASPTPNWYRYYNLVNARTAAWSSLVPTITQYLSNHGAGATMKPVRFTAWLEALNHTAARTDDVKKNPGIKLLEFFGSMSEGAKDAELETTQTARRSETMRELKPVGPEWMKTWLQQWDF